MAFLFVWLFGDVANLSGESWRGETNLGIANDDRAFGHSFYEFGFANGFFLSRRFVHQPRPDGYRSR